MFQTDLNHYEVVRCSLAGERATDEQTHASIAILQEKMDRLEKCNSIFAGIGFSPDVRGLARQKSQVAAG